MSNNTNVISGIEQGRAKFAYACAEEGKAIFKERARQMPDRFRTGSGLVPVEN